MMFEDFYIVVSAVLLPLTAGMLVAQRNPYHALVIRGIVGAVAALVYALFGAADVALTEALVGTMLSITLYAIAVRSSMSLRLGLLAAAPCNPDEPASQEPPLAQPLSKALRQALSRHYLRLEIVPYASPQALQFALEKKEIHATCTAVTETLTPTTAQSTASAPYHLSVRLPRLLEIVQNGVPPTLASVSFCRSRQITAANISDSPDARHNIWESQP